MELNYVDTNGRTSDKVASDANLTGEIEIDAEFESVVSKSSKTVYSSLINSEVSSGTILSEEVNYELNSVTDLNDRSLMINNAVDNPSIVIEKIHIMSDHTLDHENGVDCNNKEDESDSSSSASDSRLKSDATQAPLLGYDQLPVLRNLLFEGVKHEEVIANYLSFPKLHKLRTDNNISKEIICHMSKLHHITKDNKGLYRVRICKTCLGLSHFLELGLYPDLESAILVNDVHEFLNNRKSHLHVICDEDIKFISQIFVVRSWRHSRSEVQILALIQERLEKTAYNKSRLRTRNYVIPHQVSANKLFSLSTGADDSSTTYNNFSSFQPKLSGSFVAPGSNPITNAVLAGNIPFFSNGQETFMPMENQLDSKFMLSNLSNKGYVNQSMQLQNTHSQQFHSLQNQMKNGLPIQIPNQMLNQTQPHMSYQMTNTMQHFRSPIVYPPLIGVQTTLHNSHLVPPRVGENVLDVMSHSKQPRTSQKALQNVNHKAIIASIFKEGNDNLKLLSQLDALSNVNMKANDILNPSLNGHHATGQHNFHQPEKYFATGSSQEFQQRLPLSGHPQMQLNEMKIMTPGDRFSNQIGFAPYPQMLTIPHNRNDLSSYPDQQQYHHGPSLYGVPPIGYGYGYQYPGLIDQFYQNNTYGYQLPSYSSFQHQPFGYIQTPEEILQNAHDPSQRIRNPDDLSNEQAPEKQVRKRKKRHNQSSVSADETN